MTPEASPSSGGLHAAADRVLILAPVGRDGMLATRLLRHAGFRADVYAPSKDLHEVLEAGVGAVLLTEEALVPSFLRPLTTWLQAQSAWSDLPIVLCIDARRSAEEAQCLVDLIRGSGSVTVLDRPLRSSTLVSVVNAALHARRRQYEVRDLLGRLTEVNTEFRALNANLEHRVSQRTRALQDRTEQVQELAAALTYAEQQERARIAEVLHDHLQQLVFGIQLKLQMLRGAGSDEQRTDLIEQADRLADQAMEATRTLTVELNPPVLAENDFVLIVKWLASHFEDTHGFEVEIVSDGACEIRSREIRTLLAQSVRELLFNAAKHAGVRGARVRLEEADDDLLIHVEDDGHGFDPAEFDGAPQEQGFGLHSVRERMRLFGAELLVDAVPGDGARLTIRIPCDVAAEAFLPASPTDGRALSPAPASPPAGPSSD